jgi:hypothetical protein
MLILLAHRINAQYLIASNGCTEKTPSLLQVPQLRDTGSNSSIATSTVVETAKVTWRE